MADEGASTGVSRRKFLAATGTATAGTIAMAGAAEAAGEKTPHWAQEADIIVVGGGCAGFSAAVSAAKRGNKVLLLEKASMVGGTTAKSSGVWWVPNNPLMRRDKMPDPKEDALRYMARVSFPSVYNAALPKLGLGDRDYALLDAYYDNANAATEEFAAMNALKYAYSTGYDGSFYPDYFAYLPENKAPKGRGLRPDVPPERAAQGGAEMIRQLSATATSLGAQILTNCRVDDLVMDAKGRVIGATATHEGTPSAFRARKGVIFGSGGFTHDQQMVAAHLPGPISGGCAVPTNTGDFIKIATRYGAQLDHMTKAWWSQLVLEQAVVSRSTPDDVFFFPNGSGFLVNRHGRRVVDEKMVYNERTQVHFVWDPVAGEFPNQLLFYVYDERVRANPGIGRYTYPLPAANRTAPYVIKGASFAELAANIDARLQKLIAGGHLGEELRLDANFADALGHTRERFNGFAESGVDLDFGRGATIVDRSFEHAEPNGKPNPTLYPMAADGPYYCIIIAAGTLDTKGGPRINEKAQVLDAADKPIPGLYGAGNCIASPAAHAYWGGGGTIGPALTFGYIAGKNASEEQPA